MPWFFTTPMSIDGGRLAAVLLVLVGGAACRASAVDARPPIVQPGAPGEPSRVVTPDRAVDLAQVRTTPADVRFMQGMIDHHAQALQMIALPGVRTAREDMRLLARRIELSQADEIRLMRAWLRARGQAISSGHAHDLMPGMLTPEDMGRLARASGGEFERLFLDLMIKHHDGALVMVNDLFANPGAGQDSEIFSFASDVEADQRMEIARMSAMLAELQK